MTDFARIDTGLRPPVKGDFAHIYRDERLGLSVALTPLERAIIELPAFQRLQDVSQMASAYTRVGQLLRGYTRFRHSISVLKVADQLSDAAGLDMGSRTRLRLIGLTHDVKHGPFSHTLDKYTKEKLGHDHDEGLDHFFDRRDIGRVLHQGGVNPLGIVCALRAVEKDKDIFSLGVDGKGLCDRLAYVCDDLDLAGCNRGAVAEIRRVVAGLLQNVRTYQGNIYFPPEADEALHAFEKYRGWNFAQFAANSVRVTCSMIYRAVRDTVAVLEQQDPAEAARFLQGLPDNSDRQLITALEKYRPGSTEFLRTPTESQVVPVLSFRLSELDAATVDYLCPRKEPSSNPFGAAAKRALESCRVGATDQFASLPPLHHAKPVPVRRLVSGNLVMSRRGTEPPLDCCYATVYVRPEATDSIPKCREALRQEFARDPQLQQLARATDHSESEQIQTGWVVRQLKPEPI